MDNRNLLETLARSFNPDQLVEFLRMASGKFRPEKADYSHYLDGGNFVRNLQKLGKIDFDDSRRLIVLAGVLDGELSSQSGKQRQYEIAKKVMKAENVDAAIFVFHDEKGNFRFSWITAQYTGTKREFSSFRRYTYFVSPDQAARTFVEYIGKADFSSIEKITEAFSVEPVTTEFFRKYREIFEQAEATIKLKWTDEKKRLYTQRFFNRVMFLAFLERKGWLNFNGRRDYLKALFADYHENETEKRATFHRSRLNTLFFWGLNNPRGDERSSPEFQELKRRVGDVPYLNGGLFDQEADDEEYFFPDAVVAKILSELVYQFNFTVTESTPLDVEVAVDPEMLGRIFEELVTGRHESGSYYTPKPVVAFMCREALKGYLGTAMPKESSEALALFVDKNDASALRNPELALNALRTVKVCDPACGSGAYLLGMLHELLEQRECLFVASKLDARNTYDRKLEIIQNNLYGVDKDNFAVNIARLRLWLSLIVDYEGETPPPLPNLDFKIEAGDSLIAPDPSGGSEPDLIRYSQIQEFVRLKNEFQNLHDGQAKKKALFNQIETIRTAIAEGTHKNKVLGFDWAVEFAEVFEPELAQSTLSGKMTGIVNTAGGQMEMNEAPKEGGFDIVLANPPYVRQELLGDFKNLLKPIYPEVYNGTADLFVYFYARAHQLLRNGGVSCFISSNKWLRSGYGEKLRQHLLDSQSFQIVIDFGDAAIFQAVAYPSIFLWKKQPRDGTYTLWATVNDLQACYDEGILEHITRIGLRIPAKQFGKDKPRLAQPHDAEKQIAMESSGPRLLEYVKGQIYSGIKTGLNDAFVVDDGTYKKIISKSAKSKDILMPLLRGEDIRRYETQFHNSYLILTKIGVDIEKYPAVFNHLKEYEKAARQRYDQGNHWWELRACAYYDDFNSPKIVYGEIAPDARFVIDYDQYYLLNTSYFIPVDDWFLLGVLNSQPIDWYFRKIGATIQSGYLRFIRQYVETLPIPDASQKERDAVAKLAKQAQDLHKQRRKRVEKFLRELGIEPDESTSRNPLESPWSLSEEDFTRRAGRDGLKAYKSAREETISLTEEAVRVEKEIDERVKSLYGV